MDSGRISSKREDALEAKASQAAKNGSASKRKAKRKATSVKARSWKGQSLLAKGERNYGVTERRGQEDYNFFRVLQAGIRPTFAEGMGPGSSCRMRISYVVDGPCLK